MWEYSIWGDLNLFLSHGHLFGSMFEVRSMLCCFVWVAGDWTYGFLHTLVGKQHSTHWTVFPEPKHGALRRQVPECAHYVQPLSVTFSGRCWQMFLGLGLAWFGSWFTGLLCVGEQSAVWCPLFVFSSCGFRTMGLFLGCLVVNSLAFCLWSFCHSSSV